MAEVGLVSTVRALIDRLNSACRLHETRVSSLPSAVRPLGPYVERYFVEVAEVWSRRTSERAQSVVVGLLTSPLLSRVLLLAGNGIAC